MKTYNIEQAQYNIKWHKDKDMLDKYRLLRVRNEDAYYKATPSMFHAFIYNEGELVACVTRDSYKQAEQVAQEMCSYK